MDNQDQTPATVNETSDHIQKWNSNSHIKLTDISGHLWLAIAHLEEYKRQLPASIEQHQISVALRHTKKALIAYSLTNHSQTTDVNSLPFTAED